MNTKAAIKTLLALQIVFILFHLCIIVKIIPYDITWGGRLNNDNEMYQFEFMSILIIIVFALTLLIRGGYIRQFISHKATSIILWVFMILFVLNTIGNLLAVTLFEKLFSIVTILYCVLLWVILDPLKKNEKQIVSDK